MALTHIWSGGILLKLNPHIRYLWILKLTRVSSNWLLHFLRPRDRLFRLTVPICSQSRRPQAPPSLYFVFCRALNWNTLLHKSNIIEFCIEFLLAWEFQCHQYVAFVLWVLHKKPNRVLLKSHDNDSFVRNQTICTQWIVIVYNISHMWLLAWPIVPWRCDKILRLVNCDKD